MVDNNKTDKKAVPRLTPQLSPPTNFTQRFFRVRAT